MFFSLFLCGLIAILSAIYLLQLFYKWRRFVRQIDKIPGPCGYPIIGNTLEFFSPPDEILGAFYGRYKTYGPVYRVWNGPVATVVIAKAEYLEKIMNNYVNLDKTLLYKFMLPWLGRGLVNIPGPTWRPRRKILTPAFHFKMLEGFLEIMGEKSKDLVKLLKKKSKDGQEIKMLPLLSTCALDIIYGLNEMAVGELERALNDFKNRKVTRSDNINLELINHEAAMGLSSRTLASECETDYIKYMMMLSKYTVAREMKPWLHPDFMYKLSSEGKEYFRIVKLVHEETDRVIEQRRKYWEANKINDLDDEGQKLGIKKQEVFLDAIFHAVKNGKKLSAEDIRDEVTTFLFAGHDTTGVAMAWSLLYLAMYPDVQEKVANEMESIFQDSDRQPTMNDINEMKYLECVVKEILRLYPSSPFIGRTLAEDTKFGDYVVPAGTEVTMDLYSTHRDPKYFPNPEKFNPDNFLPDVVVERHPYAYVPFSAGPRNCIGQRFALLELKALVATVVRNFKLETNVSPNEIETFRTIFIAHKQQAPLRLISRK